MLINFNSMPVLGPISSATPSFGDFGKAMAAPDLSLPELDQFNDDFNALGQPQVQPSVGDDFAKMLSEAIAKVDAQDEKAQSVALDMALGKPVDPHTVMIEYAKDSTMIHLTSGISTKMAQDFTTLMNMQI